MSQKLNVLDMKKSTIDSPRNRANKALIDAVANKYTVPVTSRKQASDILFIDTVKDVEGVEKLAVEAGLFTKSEAVKLNLI